MAVFFEDGIGVSLHDARHDEHYSEILVRSNSDFFERYPTHFALKLYLNKPVTTSGQSGSLLSSGYAIRLRTPRSRVLTVATLVTLTELRNTTF
ncbi:hypothetical protein TNCV_2329851 [Trichonephila clavipes]|nr:hypothetical protein TNCV_2329851 [Trichonephila clavipes]